jgi:hypothetical protein
MTSREVKLAKLQRWKDKKPYSARLTLIYWRYSHQVHGDFLSQYE